MGAPSYSTMHKGRGPVPRYMRSASSTAVGYYEVTAADRDGTSEMLALIYVFTIWCVASILFVTVHEFEPDRRLAFVLRVPRHRSRRRGNRKAVDALVSLWQCAAAMGMASID